MPLVVLVIVTLLARLAGQLGAVPLRNWAAATRVGLAVMFCFTAAAHFNSMRPDLVRMVPPAVPYPEFMVTFTGICEVLGAIGLLVPRTRRVAAIALILFLLAVLPAKHSRGAFRRYAARDSGHPAGSQDRDAGPVHRAGLVGRCSSRLTQRCESVSLSARGEGHDNRDALCR